MSRCSFCGWTPLDRNGDPRLDADGHPVAHHPECKEARKLQTRELARHVSASIIEDETESILKQAEAIKARRASRE